MATQTNRFFRATPLSSESRPFVLPAKELAFALDLQQKRYDETELLEDELSNTNVNALPEEVSVRNRIIQGINSEIDKVRDMYGKDFVNAGSALKKLKRKVERLKGQGGQLNAIETNYETYTKGYEDQLKRVGTKDGPTAEDFRLGISAQRATFGNLPEKDPDTGAFRRFQMEPFEATVSFEEMANKLGAEYNKNPKVLEKAGFFKDPLDGRYVRYVHNRKETFTEEDMAQLIMTSMLNDPKGIAYAKQFLKFRGVDPTPDAIASIMAPSAINAAKAFKVDNFEVDQTRAVDKFEEILFKKQLDLDSNQIQIIGWELDTNTQTGPSTTYGTNFLTGKIFREGAAIFDMVKDITLEGDIRDPNHRYYNDPTAKKAREELAAQKINIKDRTPREATNLMATKMSEINERNAQVRGAIFNFGNETTDGLSDSFFRQRRYLNGYIQETTKSGEVKAPVWGQTLQDNKKWDAETVEKGSYVPKYHLPAGLAKGGFELSIAGDNSGSKYVLLNPNHNAQMIELALEKQSQIFLPGVNVVRNIDFSLIIGSSYGGILDATMDETGQIHYSKPDGTPVPITEGQINFLAGQKIINFGGAQEVKGVTKGGTPLKSGT